LARFRTTLRLHREYLGNTTRYHQSENGVKRYLCLYLTWQFWADCWTLGCQWNWGCCDSSRSRPVSTMCLFLPESHCLQRSVEHNFI